jgi:hypothetical protein
MEAFSGKYSKKLKKTKNQENEFSTTPTDHNEVYPIVAYIIENFGGFKVNTGHINLSISLQF